MEYGKEREKEGPELLEPSKIFEIYRKVSAVDTIENTSDF